MTRLLVALVLAFLGFVGWQIAVTQHRVAGRTVAAAVARDGATHDSLAAEAAYQALRGASRGAPGRPADAAVVPDWVLRARSHRLTSEDPPADRQPGDAERVRDASRRDAYLAQVAAANQGALRRWAPREGPVLVWVEGNPGIPGWTSGYRDVARGALAEWNAPGLPIRLAATDDSSEADIFVLWTRRFGDGSQRIGVTQPIWTDAGWLQLATITIALETSGGALLDLPVVQNVARHELGHAIGLDHSPWPDDLMAPSEAGQPRLTARDVETARLLYSMAPGPLYPH